MSLALLLALASASLPSARANILFGGATSTAACYDALRSSRLPGSERVDKEGYVKMVNELSDGAFTAFRKGPSGEWGHHPVASFDQLPAAARDEFYRHACGGPHVICEEAYLYARGVDGAGEAPAQQEVYLYQVCAGVEGAIEASKPKMVLATAKPTDAPARSPTRSPTARGPTSSPNAWPREELTLTYRAAASAKLDTRELRSTESVGRAELLGAMNEWSFMTAAKYDAHVGEGETGSVFASPGSRLLRGGRKLVVTPVPLVENLGEELIWIVGVACDPDMNNSLQPGDHCIEVTSNLTLVFRNEPDGARQDAVIYFENQFERDIADGTYYNLIGGTARQEIRAPLYLPGSTPAAEVPAPAPGEAQVAPNVDGNPFSEGEPTLEPAAQSAEETLVGLLMENGAAPGTLGSGEGGGSKSNVGAVAGGAIAGLFAIGLIVFTYRRVKNRPDQFSEDSGSYYGKQREFDAADDLEGGRHRASSDGGGSLSWDESSSGDGRSSGSVESYSGSEASSRMSMSGYSSADGRGRDRAPSRGGVEGAVEKGDGTAAGAAAAVPASSGWSAPKGPSIESNALDSHRRAESPTLSDLISVNSAAAESSGAGSHEEGNWDGVAAVAAQYADEAGEADESLGLPLSQHGSRHNSLRSEGSVSVDDAFSLFSNTTRDSGSHTTYSVDDTMSFTMTGDGASTMSGTDSRTPPDAGTVGSSTITSSHVSGAVTESMVSAESSLDLQENRRMNAYRATVEALVCRVLPDEIDNVDDIMVQFSGREEELMETLRAMQEKSIAERARAAVQRSAKLGASRSSRGKLNDDESSYGQSSTSYGQTVTTDSQMSSSATHQLSQATGDEYSTGSGSRDSGSEGDGWSDSSSYSSRTWDSRSSGISGSEYSESQPDGLSDSINSSDWHAVREATVQPGGDRPAPKKAPSRPVTGISRDTRDELDDMIDDGNWTGIIDAANSMARGHADDLD